MNAIEDIEHAYDTMEKAASSGWTVTSVFWRELTDYHAALKRFDSSIKLHSLDETWRQFLTFCRRYIFHLACTPLSPRALIKQMWKWRISEGVQLHHLKRTLDENMGRDYSRLVDAFAALNAQSSNPLWDAARMSLFETWESGADIAVLCTESRLRPVIQDYLSSQLEEIGTCSILKPSELKTFYTYDHFLTFGPAMRSLFDGSEFAYISPRSGLLELYVPNVFKAILPEPYQFSGSPHRVRNFDDQQAPPTFADPQFRIIGVDHQVDTLPMLEDDEGWLSSLPAITPFSQTPDETIEGFGWSEELVAVRQILLTADHGVFLSADGGTYRVGYSRDTETQNLICSGVEYADVGDLGPGDILLFQEHGGGSMVAEVANELMGDRAHEFRRIQSDWKAPLREMVSYEGAYSIVRKLQEMGASIKTSISVRNWCQAENIGPGQWKDFELLLQILHLCDRKQEIFEATRTIRSAHKSAGFKLADRLVKMMKGRSLKQLEEIGCQEFSGVKGMPNRKIAYEIVAVLPDTAEVQRGQIQHPFTIK